jgi:hypothetical protein
MTKTFSERMKDAAATNDYDIVNDLIKNDPSLHNFRHLMQEYILGRDTDLSEDMVNEILNLPALKTKQPHLESVLGTLTNMAVSQLDFGMVDKLLNISKKPEDLATSALANIFNQSVLGASEIADMEMIGARAKALIARGADETRAFSEGNYRLRLQEENLEKSKGQRDSFLNTIHRKRN